MNFGKLTRNPGVFSLAIFSKKNIGIVDVKEKKHVVRSFLQNFSALNRFLYELYPFNFDGRV